MGRGLEYMPRIVKVRESDFFQFSEQAVFLTPCSLLCDWQLNSSRHTFFHMLKWPRSKQSLVARWQWSHTTTWLNIYIFYGFPNSTLFFSLFTLSFYMPSVSHVELHKFRTWKSDVKVTFLVCCILYILASNLYTQSNCKKNKKGGRRKLTDKQKPTANPSSSQTDGSWSSKRIHV